ncbi:MAG: capsule biosynthesis protein CapK, partial [Candidatus Bathyarchaeum sp.]
MSYADANVPFYHQRFKEAKFNPNTVKSVEDLCKIPVLTKADIQNNFDSLISKRVNATKCRKGVTSGSTGNPLTILADKRASHIMTANGLRHYLENGGQFFKDRYALLTVVRQPVKRTLFGSLLIHFGFSKKVKFNTQSPIAEVLDNLVNFNPDVIDCYPSYLLMLARELEKSDKSLSPRLMFGFGELLDDNSRKIINSAFGTEIFDTYGCTEAGDIAWECSGRIGYHINTDLVTTEFVKDNEPVAAEESGEILLTPLWNYAMPLIRYRIGDVGTPCDEICSCGRGLPLMKVLEGRFEDFIVLPNGEIISPLNNLTYFDKFDCVTDYRIIQERREKLVLQVVLKE